MRRRQFISLVGGAAAWLLAARVNAADAPLIGVLLLGKRDAWDLAGFNQGLKDLGFVAGENVAIEYRFGEDDPERMPKLAADLVNRRVRVLVAIASSVAAKAAKDATATIPVVFGFGVDPVAQGLVASLNKPGANVTGVTSMASELFGKQLGILHELVPQAARIGILANPRGAQYQTAVRDTEAAAARLGLKVEILPASTGDEIDAILAQGARDKRVDALLVTNEPVFVAERARLAALAARNALPAIYPFRDMAAAGGLISYGTNVADRDREIGHYVGRVLKGENPAEMPVLQMSKFDLVINIKTARALNIAIPNSLQVLADEVIE